jgi:hypothetical protein
MNSISNLPEIILDDDTDIFYCKGGHCVCCIQKSTILNLVYVDWLITQNNSNKLDNKFYCSTIALYLCDKCTYFCPTTTYGNLDHDGLDKIIKNIKTKYLISKL